MSDIQGEKAWYAVHTYSGYEKKVESNLKKRIETMNMEDYIFQCIVPVEKLIEDRNGKPKQVERKIFPGYVLVEMILNDESWYVVRNTTGVTGFVGSGNKPVPLQDYEVEDLLRQMGEDLPVRVFDMEIGDNVNLLKGSFVDMVGKIIQIDRENERVVVEFELFGRQQSVTTDFSKVKKAD